MKVERNLVVACVTPSRPRARSTFEDPKFSMSAPVPQAVGTLESTPFGELLIQALDNRLTGTLILEEGPGTRHGVYLEAGTPRRAKLAAPTPHLGEVLVDTGAISPEVHERTLERA